MLTKAYKAALAALCLTLTLATPAFANERADDGDASARRALQAPDLKQACGQHDAEAGSVRGWARSRFEQCHHYKRHVILYTQDGVERGYVDFELWILAFAYDGSRRVDYVTSVENVHQTTSLSDGLTFLTVTYSGCSGQKDVACSGALERADTIAGWYQKPGMDVITATSPDTAGAGPFLTVPFAAQVGLLLEYRDGRTVPWQENTAYNAVRFDSAGPALGNGKFKGTVFTDFVPALVLPLTGAGIDQEARHVDDALHRPWLTFPSFVGKNPPGENRPLHRLMNAALADSNHATSVGICKDVWGDDYTSGGLDCDEYPFKSTYEGSFTSTTGTTTPWHGSARPIDSGDNQRGGTKLASFYGENRVLDNDAFKVATTP